MTALATRRIKIRATIICYRNGKILLVRKKGAKWNLPGGTVEPGETAIEAARREMREETSIAIEGLLPLTIIEAGRVRHHIFTAHVSEQTKAVPQNEIADCCWVSKTDLSPAKLKATFVCLLDCRLPALTA